MACCGGITTCRRSAASACRTAPSPTVYERVRGRMPAPGAAGERRLLYLGAMWAAAHDTVRAFLAALRLLKTRAPALYRTCRVDFVGTTYAPDGSSECHVRQFAEEAGVGDVVTETPKRLPFLDANRGPGQRRHPADAGVGRTALHAVAASALRLRAPPDFRRHERSERRDGTAPAPAGRPAGDLRRRSASGRSRSELCDALITWLEQPRSPICRNRTRTGTRIRRVP
jgi:hypothetical protein